MSMDLVYRDPLGNIISEDEWNEAQADLADNFDDYVDEAYDFASVYQFQEESDEDYDFEDIDCCHCGLKFFVRPSLYGEGKKPWPTICHRCEKGLAPLYEY
jgi:hypothetical protein